MLHLLSWPVGDYHLVLAIRQFVTMRYNCFCGKSLLLHVIESAASDPDPWIHRIWLENIKNHRDNNKNKRTKEVEGTTFVKSLENKQNCLKTFRPMSPKSDLGLTVLLLICLVFPTLFVSCSLDLFGSFVFVIFPQTTKRAKAGNRRGQSSIMPWRPPRTRPLWAT